VIEALDEAGIGDVLTTYLGERPVLSVKKTSLRWATAGTDAIWWHQDGRFLGRDIRAVNVWIALSHCGVDAPSLDFVARRMDRIVETGTEGARHGWSVSDDVAARAASDATVVRPVFAPGDALLFDQLLLHRTGVSPTMTRDRLAVEAWCFAPSTFPAEQIPIVY
jgi:ectoine hydroxylase-related dioxygenase (phytanoyl-CoA dioxygenase family)